MTTATIHHRRPTLSLFSLLVASAGVGLGVVAIATDDAGSITPARASVVAIRDVPDSSNVTDRAGDCLVRRPGNVATHC